MTKNELPYLAGKLNHAAGKLVPLPRNIHESVNPTRFQQGPEQKTRYKIDVDFY
jgi:hypothetical protein